MRGRPKQLSATALLTMLLSADGPGSGLDADLLDGQQGAFYAAATDVTAAAILTKLLTVDGVGSGLDADLLDGNSSAYYLAASSYTAADVLAKLLTVDGAGSGLDADLLDGNSSDYYLAASSYTANDVLVKLLSIDGAGSGLDADLLDGQQGAFYAAATDVTAAAILTKLLTVDGAGSGLDADLLDGYHAADFAFAAQIVPLELLDSIKTVDGAGSGLDADLLDGQSGAFYAAATDVTAAAILTKLLTVDGALSGLDADLLDGQDGAYYRDASNLNAGSIPAARIANDTVTYALMQNVSAASKLLGRGDSGAGDPQEITLGAGLSMSGTTLSATSGAAEFWASITNATEVAITAAGSATLNRMHVVSGTTADFDITISGLTPAAGDVVGCRVADWTAASKQYRLDAGGTVKIAGRTRYLTLLHTNVVLLMWDGTGWQPLVLNLDTPWIDAGAITVTASTTNPTKGTTTVDKYFWRRVGDTCEMKFHYYMTTAGTAGSGTYRLGLPFAYDTARVVQVAEGTGKQEGESKASLGIASMQHIGFTDAVGSVIATTANNTTVSLVALNGPGTVNYVWNSAAFHFATTPLGIYANFAFPVTNW